jgi:ribosomal protein S18 acetylase RimI-like enzyme
MTDLNFKIRKANVADISQIVEFQLKMAMETESLELNKPKLKKGVEFVFQSNLADYFVAEFNGNLIASLMITYEWSDWRNAIVLWIQSVYVLEKYRRNSVFSKMYHYVKKISESSEKYAGIRLYVDKSNKNAIATYLSLGMDNQHYEMFEDMD